MSSNEIETNDVNGSQLAEQGPFSGSVLNRGTLVVIMQILSLRREESGLAKRIRSLWSAVEIRGYRKCILSLWLQKGMF